MLQCCLILQCTTEINQWQHGPKQMLLLACTRTQPVIDKLIFNNSIREYGYFLFKFETNSVQFSVLERNNFSGKIDDKKLLD